jgi:hypothetical protein
MMFSRKVIITTLLVLGLVVSAGSVMAQESVSANVENVQVDNDTVTVDIVLSASTDIGVVDTNVSATGLKYVETKDKFDKPSVVTRTTDVTNNSLTVKYTDISDDRTNVTVATLVFENNGSLTGSEISTEVSVAGYVDDSLEPHRYNNKVGDTYKFSDSDGSGEGSGEASVFEEPLIDEFNNPPQNTGAYDSNLYEDLDGDGESGDYFEVIQLYKHIATNGNLELTEEQEETLDWNDDGEFDTADLTYLYSKKIRE